MLLWAIIIIFICAIGCFCAAWTIRALVGFRLHKGFHASRSLLKAIDILRYTALGLTLLGFIIAALSKALAS